MPEKIVRYGLIGIGAQGGTYAKMLTGKAGARPDKSALGALCDIDPDKKTMCEILYPDVPFYTDYKEMIASGHVETVVLMSKVGVEYV